MILLLTGLAVMPLCSDGRRGEPHRSPGACNPDSSFTRAVRRTRGGTDTRVAYRQYTVTVPRT